MSKIFKGIILLLTGGIAGYFVSNEKLKKKYEDLVQVEVDSVKEAFRKMGDEIHKNTDDETSPVNQTDTNERNLDNYNDHIVKEGYSEQKKATQVQKPRVIPPEDFGEDPEYDTITFTYYSDGTVTDDDDRPVGDEEVEETIGVESLSHFGEYEDDNVCVQNDRLKAYYEILMDKRRYSDVLREKPYLKL